MSKKLEIVLVHLRTNPPKHLQANLSHLVRSFPDYGVTLVSDLPAKMFGPLTGVTHFSVPSSGAFAEIMEASSLNDHFRGGFWPLTLARLGGLLDWHRAHPNKSMLHLESDMLLMEYAPIHRIQQLENLAWLSCNPDADLAGFIYSPTLGRSESLLREVMHELSADSEVTDMQVLFRIRKRKPNFASILAGIPEVSRASSGATDHSVNLGGVFDSLAVGMWLAGEDPRNSGGFVRYLRTYPKSYFLFSPSEVRFEIENSRLFGHIGSARQEIFSLHVHSKDIRLFDSQIRSAILGRVVSRQSGGGFRRFSSHGFKQVLRDYALAALRKFGVWSN
jgi:hypothetical protein